MDDKNIREILIGKTFDEKVVLFAPISIGCLFIWEIPSLITDACFRYLIISLIIYWMIQMFVKELVFRVEEYLMFNHRVSKD